MLNIVTHDRPFLLIAAVSTLLVFGKSASAQDPVKVAPGKYKVLLENEKVRVLRACLKPGEKIPMHSHPERVIYELSDHKSKFTFPHKPSTVGESKAGQAKWGAPVVHSEENIGTTEGCAVIVELKH
jgi:hypothetical protein